jgi:hypothetical protein
VPAARRTSLGDKQRKSPTDGNLAAFGNSALPLAAAIALDLRNALIHVIKLHIIVRSKALPCTKTAAGSVLAHL